MNVWVVDDDPDFLTAANYRIMKSIPDAVVSKLEDPVDAIRRLSDGEKPDLVISDLIFRGIASGEDVVAAARARGIPAVLCSDVHPSFWPGVTRKINFLEGMAQHLRGLALGA